MARRIRTTEEAAGEPVVEQVPQDGVVFINNYPNREFHIGNGVKFKFSGTREVITDPTLIKFFTDLAKEGTQRIFIHDQSPAPTEPVVTEPVYETPEPEQTEESAVETPTE